MNNGIKSWSKTDRPREKMVEKGAVALSDAELIAIILGSGNKSETAVDLASRILKDSENDLQKLSKKNVKTLSAYNGIGMAKAVTLMAALELGNRQISVQTCKQKICTSDDAYQLICQFLHNRVYESFWAIYLDGNNCVVDVKKIGSGSMTMTLVDQKKIFKIALEISASSIILCHNHPSGIVTPSHQDRLLTYKIKESCRIVDIQLIDHIIVGDERFYSFADNNEL